MEMILTESGFEFASKTANKPESLFIIDDIIKPKLDDQKNNVTVNDLWRVVKVVGYDKINGYTYCIEPESDEAKAWAEANAIEGEGTCFEICGFENSPEEQEWVLANESKSIKENKDEQGLPADKFTEYDLLNLDIGTRVDVEDMMGKIHSAYVVGSGDKSTILLTFDEYERLNADTDDYQEVSISNIVRVYNDDLNESKSIKEDKMTDWDSTDSLGDDMDDKRIGYTVVVFEKNGGYGKTIGTYDNEKEAKEVVDSEYPNAKSVVIRKEEARGRFSNPFLKRDNGQWQRYSNKEWVNESVDEFEFDDEFNAYYDGYTEEDKDENSAFNKLKNNVDESIDESKYITDEIASKTTSQEIKDAIDKNNLSVLVRDNTWYTEKCPNGLGKALKDEMKKLYPDLKHMYDESKSIKEDADKNYNPVDTVDIAVDNVIENIMNSELGNLAQQIAALGKGYNADWCAVEADSPTSQAVVKALENLGDALKADLLANYNKNESLKESIEDEYASITALADDCGENVFKEFSTGLRFRFMNDDNAIKFMDKLREMNITFDEMATGVIRVDKVNLVSESFNDEVFEYNEHQYKVEKRHVYKRQVRTSYFDSYDEAKLDAEEWINDADKHLKIYAKGLTNSAFAYIYHWNGTEFEYIELVNSETIEKERKSVKESFDYNENSEEDQGLFDGIGTQVVDTIFPGVQFEGKEMEKLDDAIDNLIWVYKSVKARSSKAVKESIDNKHYKM